MTKIRTKLFLILSFFSLSLAATPLIIYVTPDGSTSTSVDGLSWANAVDINRGKSLSNYYFGQGTDNQVWVKGGTYNLTGSAFQINANMAFYGGFNGTETDFSLRNWKSNETIINQTGNAQVIWNNAEYNVIMDGFIFQGGNITTATAGGCGSLSNGVTLRNCIVRNNKTAGTSGAFKLNAVSGSVKKVIIENCLIINNESAASPSVITATGVPFDLINTTIANNYNATSGAQATIASTNVSFAFNIYNCIFYNNKNSAAVPAALGANANKVAKNNAWEVAPTDGTLSSNIVISSSPFVSPTTFVGAANGTTQLFSSITSADFKLASGSTCINAGDNSFSTLTTDIAGATRIQNTTIDMGCYETSVTTGLQPKVIKGLMVSGNLVVLPQGSANQNVEVLNANGTILKSFSTNNGTLVIDNKGLFLVRIGNDTYKIVK